MKTTLSKPTADTRKPAVRKTGKKLPTRQTRAEFVAEVKAIAARVDAGTERLYSSQEVRRALGL